MKNSLQIRLDMAGEIDDIRRRYGHGTSSHSFPMLYLWRNAMGLTIRLDKDFFAVQSSWRGKNSFFFPCGAPETVKAFLEEHRHEPDFRLCYMRREDVEFLEEHFPGVFEISPDNTSSEYLYDRAAQATMAGKRFAKLRVKLHHFLREHRTELVPLSAENLEEARFISLQWAAQQRELPAFNDVEMSLEALSLFGALQLAGILVRVDGEPSAFALGFALSDTVFDVCVLKQHSHERGLFEFVMRELCAWLPESFQLVNMEEDLGIEGLRAHKQEMVPSGYNEMWEGKVIT